MQDVIFTHTSFSELIQRQVNTASARIFTDITNDIGELKCHAQIMRIFKGFAMLKPEDLARRTGFDWEGFKAED